MTLGVPSLGLGCSVNWSVTRFRLCDLATHYFKAVV